MAEPRVAVVITCYDLGRYLDEALDSVLAQSLQDLEILVVDDGSTDPETVALLADYRRPKTRVIHSDNRGVAAAKNLGIRETSAPYVCTVDADDRLAPTWLETAAARLDADPGLAFVSHWFRTFGDETWPWQPTACDLPALLEANTVSGAAVVRRSALEAVGGFDETFRHGCEDWALWLAMVERGLRGVIVPEVMLEYRRRAGSITRVMLDGAYLVNVRRLLDRHADAYRTHAPAILAAREARTARLLDEIDALEREDHEYLLPARARQHERLTALRAKAADVERERAAAAETARSTQAIKARDDEIRRLDVARSRAERDAAELRASLSWRITAPLRALWRGLRRPPGRA
jgi:glycosyltransferase involved in cell wall biosynthesis